MKILLISSGHGLDDDRVSRKQGVSLVRLGHDVTLCGRQRLPYSEPRLRLIDVDTLEVLDGIDVNRQGNARRLQRMRRLPNLFRLCKQTRPDLVVAQEFETATLAMLMKWCLGVPYVFDVHECFEKTMPLVFPAGVRGVASASLRAMLRWVVGNASGVTAASPASLAYMHAQRIGLPACILHNAPILDHFPFSEVEGPVPVVVHEGDLTFERGAIEMLEALAIVNQKRSVRFLILGTIPDAVENVFMKKIRDLGLTGVVDSRGRLPWTEFGELEATGQIGLICSQPVPNHMLSLSNKLYNYMACGLAVIGMKGSETEKIIQKYECGIAVDTSRPEEIAKGMVWMIDHPNERREMARLGRKAIEDELGWHCMERTMAEFYHKMAEGIDRKAMQ